jgi:intracellular sulfur oxidation DsrE/DsrF family protein
MYNMTLRHWLGTVSLVGAFLVATSVRTQEAGPVIQDFGKVYEIADPDIPDSPITELKAVFDVYASSESGNGINPQLETAARFLNMHVKAGVPREKLKVALVVHGKATEDLLTEAAYRARHGSENINAVLVRDLIQAGVNVAVCGQSASARDINRAQLIPGVQWALSAMTALVHYQDMGYRYIRF